MNSIRELLEYSTDKFSNVPAVKWAKGSQIESKTYKELNESVTSIRKGIKAEGFSKSHLALIGTSSVSWIESYLAITSGDNVAIPLDPLLPADDLVELVDRSDSEAVFLEESNILLAEKILKCCPKVKQIYLFTTNGNETFKSLEDLKEASDSAEDSKNNSGDDTAMIIFTSGTTGKSKGVMLSHTNLITNVEAVEYDVEPGKTLLSVLPVHHAFCLVMDWLKGFSLGATVCINDSFLHMARNMTLFKPEVMLMVPMIVETIYKKLESAAKLLPKKLVAQKAFGGNLKTVFVGGAHLDKYYIDKFAAYGVNIYEGYGMSECSPVISSNTPTCHKPGSVGKVLKNAQVAFEDGEVLVKSTSVMQGYYKMPSETAETLKDGWLHTGDKGYIDEDGFLYINGRVKNLIILSNGENISPEEIENKLALEKLIEEVVITGEDNILTARIYPDQEYIKKKKWNDETVKLELQKILDSFNKSQPSYKKLSRLVVRKNPFVRNTTKKILRQKALLDEPA
ncbi:MAG: AMP-binding protein [Butyrivibrio sp.]|uniref:AMP-binding protein n=1 Tax=Butyrivibrio sp. TaxID=28121 RepID=UPI0025DE5B4A|nr:AMP-binding protein [Butyrivibrio sp.]MCR5771730.1 AMP-binding protein [Butyrivibrio sp.]